MINGWIGFFNLDEDLLTKLMVFELGLSSKNEWLALSDTESNSPRSNNYSKENLISGFGRVEFAPVRSVFGVIG